MKKKKVQMMLAAMTMAMMIAASPVSNMIMNGGGITTVHAAEDLSSKSIHIPDPFDCAWIMINKSEADGSINIPVHTDTSQPTVIFRIISPLDDPHVNGNYNFESLFKNHILQYLESETAAGPIEDIDNNGFISEYDKAESIMTKWNESEITALVTYLWNVYIDEYANKDGRYGSYQYYLLDVTEMPAYGGLFTAAYDPNRCSADDFDDNVSDSNTSNGVTITVNGDAEEYTAYRLLDLTTSLKPGDTCTGEHTADCYNYSYTINSKYHPLFTRNGVFPEGVDTDDDAAMISWLENADADAIRGFADRLYAEMKADGDWTADMTTDTNIFTVDNQGYYMIAETRTKGDPDSVSLVMLDTAGQQNITVDSKEDVPTLVKKVQCEGDSEWYDAVDVELDKNNINFKIEAGMPENIENYKTYKYVIHDKMSSAILGNNTVVTIQDGDKNAVVDGFVKVPSDGCYLHIEFDDIIATAKANGITVTKNTKVIVTYDAQLTTDDDLTIGNSGNANTAHLTFSNDPYVEGSTSDTPEDTVKVFTFETVINKVDKDGNALAGADFTLSKKNDDGTYTAVNGRNKTTNETGTTFAFSGLDQGSYKLEETKVPDGYNKADDIYFDLEAVYDTESDDPQITSFVVKQNGVVVSEGTDAKFQISSNLGTATASVINTSGIKLPHTGAFGRAVLLGVGGCGIVVSIAAVAVAKKKKREEA